jgi:hypothetical protein
MRRLWVLGLWLLAALFAWGQGAAPAAIVIDGTGVALTPVPGYLKSPSFLGLINKEHGAAVAVATVNTPCAKAIASYTKEQFAAWGMTLVSAQPVQFGATRGQLFIATQSFNGVVWRRVMGVFGDEARTIQVVGSITDENAGKANAWNVLVTVVMSARVSAADPFGDAAFTLKEADTLKFARRDGATLVFTENGAAGDLPKTVTYTITTVATKNPIGNLSDFARTCLDNAPQVTQGNVVSEQDVTLDGLRGYQLGAVAMYKNTAKSCLYFQVVLADTGSYYLVQGFVPTTLDPVGGVRQEDLAKLKAFTAMTASFKRKTAK